MPYCCATLISLISARAACADSMSDAVNKAAVNERCICLSAFIKARQHEFAMPQRFRGGETSVRRAEHHVEQLVARLVHRDLALQESRRVDIDVLAHRAHGARICAD